MKALILYCRKYSFILGVSRLELSDDSLYECRPKVNISLI